MKQYPDIEVKEGVQIQIQFKGEFIWINIDGICVLRIHNQNCKPIEIEDNRK